MWLTAPGLVTGTDTFRIKIWTEDEFGGEIVIYDNGNGQTVGGGSIVVHTKSKQ